MSSFRLKHIPPLFIASAFTIGGALPLWNPYGAIREFGLPEHIAVSGPAQTYAIVYGSRMTIVGMAMWIFYFQGKLKAVDTLLALILYAGAVDAFVCWQEGVPNMALFRAAASIVVGGWGVLGMTAR